MQGHARQALEKLAQEHPQAVLTGGGLMATLSYLDFFQTGVQRVAVSTAALMCRSIPHSSHSTLVDAVPLLTPLLQNSVRGAWEGQPGGLVAARGHVECGELAARDAVLMWLCCRVGRGPLAVFSVLGPAAQTGGSEKRARQAALGMCVDLGLLQ